MELTNADRVVFPEDGITKGEVFDYYRRVGELMLPFIADRALTVERYPKGIGGGGFMQKNAPGHYPDDLIGRFEVGRGGGGTTIYPVVNSTDGIAFFANLGVITFHAPPATVDDLLLPDWVIWDLDPSEGHTDRVRAAAHAMRSLLLDFDLPTFVMTSGSKGYHLRARLARTADFATVADFARGAAALAAAAHPDLLTLAFKKADRGSRVFVDWLRNAPLSTAVVPWSLRARSGAPIAVPLDWEEVGSVAPDGIDLASVSERFEIDPWVGLEPVDLTEAATLVSDALGEAGIQLEPFDRFRSRLQRSGVNSGLLAFRIDARTAGATILAAMARNVLGGELETCSTDPLTGWFRDGSCRTDVSDRGSHTICAVVTQEFLEHQRSIGNDLMTPAPQFRFPGLVAGDRWCVTAVNWLRAHHDGAAAPVVLAATEESVLAIVPLDVLAGYAVDVPSDPGPLEA